MQPMYKPDISTPSGVFVLWFMGALGLVVSSGIAAYGFTKDCSLSGVNCTIESLIYQSTGMLGLFLAALFVVGGFAMRSKSRQRAQARYYETLWEQSNDQKSQKSNDREENS